MSRQTATAFRIGPVSDSLQVLNPDGTVDFSGSLLEDEEGQQPVAEVINGPGGVGSEIIDFGAGATLLTAHGIVQEGFGTFIANGQTAFGFFVGSRSGLVPPDVTFLPGEPLLSLPENGNGFYDATRLLTASAQAGGYHATFIDAKAADTGTTGLLLAIGVVGLGLLRSSAFQLRVKK